jgi:hypothetical protein
MRNARAWIVLAATSLAACSHAPLSAPADITLFGPGARFETWKASVVEGGHIHSGMAEDPCTMLGLTQALGGIKIAEKPELEERLRDSSRHMGSLMEGMIAGSYGKAHGGPDRLVLVLRHVASDSWTPDEAVVVDLPRMKPGETGRLFKKGEFQAAYERPPTTTEALLERGWVRVTRAAPDRLEFELFLVLKPARPDAGYESVQVVTRVEWPPQR